MELQGTLESGAVSVIQPLLAPSSATSESYASMGSPTSPRPLSSDRIYKCTKKAELVGSKAFVRFVSSSSISPNDFSPLNRSRSINHSMNSIAQNPPFSVIDSTDQGGLLWIAAGLSLSYFMLSCIIRVYIGYTNFHRDAFMLVLSTAFGFAQVIAVFTGLCFGFGKTIASLDSSQLVGIQRSGYASDIFFLLALSSSKCAVSWFLARLTPETKYLAFCSGSFWISIVWGVASALALALQCNLNNPWITIGAKCTGELFRWQLIVAFDIITEILLVTMTIVLVWNLQMAWRKKAIVVFGFTFRLPLIALAAIHVHFIAATANSSDPTFDQIIPGILAEVQLAWALISATIPCLRAFLDNLGSGFLGGDFVERTLATGKGYTDDSDGYVLHTLSVSQRVLANVTAGKSETMSNRSLTRKSIEGSEDLIIRKTTGYSVNYE